MRALTDTPKTAVKPVVNPARRGYTGDIKTGETTKTPKRYSSSIWTPAIVTISTEVTESERTGEKGAGGSLRWDHRGQPKASSESQDSEVRDVPAIHSVQSDMHEVSERDTRGHSERKGSVPDVQTEVKRASSPQQQIADEVRKYIESGKSFSAAKLFEIADKAYGSNDRRYRDRSFQNSRYDGEYKK